MAAKQVKSKRLTLDRVGSKITDSIVDQIKNIKVNNVPPDKTYNSVGTKGFYDLNPDLYSHTQAAQLNEGSKPPSISINTCNSLALGEAAVMNPPWQWNELDDVRSNPSYPRMGRVYNEVIAANYPIIVFQPGREQYSMAFSIQSLLGIGASGVGAHGLNDYIRSGGEQGFIKSALSLITNMTLGIIDFAFNSIFGANRFIQFKPAMKLFSRYCNELYRELAANMNLLNWMDEEDPPIEGQYNEEDMAKPDVPKDEYGGLGSSYRGTVDNLSLLSILPTSRTNTVEYRTDPKTGAVITKIIPGKYNIFKEFHNHGYISYMCQRGITVSETFSNTTEPHPIVNDLNEMAREHANSAKKGFAGDILSELKDFQSNPSIGGLSDAAKNIFASGMGRIARENVAKGSELGLLFTGGGQTSFPEIWSNSSYSRSYSLSFKFFSPPGDTISVFENLWIQTMPLITLVAPRQTAKNIYYSPFCVRVYSKGLFSVPFGMIESLSIRRGEDKNDRTVFNYPRTISVDITIKDLSPVLMLSLGGVRSWFTFHRENDGLHEYLATLGGLSISDRYAIKQRWQRFWSQIRTYWTDEVFNLKNLGYNLASSWILKPIMVWGKSKISVDKLPKPQIY